MALELTVFLGLILVTCSIQESPTSYSASLIRYLVDQSSGTFDCWFFQLSDNPEQHELMEELLQSPELSDIPKRLISSREASRIIGRQPKLLLIYGDCLDVISLRKMFACVFYPDFKESLKVIVFHQCTVRKLLTRFNLVFATAKLFNVVYIRTDHFEVDFSLQYREEFHGWLSQVNFDRLFVDQTADLNGNVVHISFTTLSLDSTLSSRKGVFHGRLLEWILGTIDHVNGSYELHRIACSEYDQDCSRRQHMMNDTTPFDFSLEMVTNSLVEAQFLDSAIPDQFLVAAPRGRKLLVYELFFISFQPPVWILLITFAIAGCLLMSIFPKQFQNDLILLPLCGFERQTLNQVSRLEKFIILPTIIMTFILTSAYESKIIAFMTSFPTVSSPRSFDDLLQAGITIQVDVNNSYGVAGDPRFGQVFKFAPFSTKKVDLTNKRLGYSGVSGEIQYFVNHPMTLETSTMLSQLVILDQFSLGIFIPFYFN
ncbi:hypothetical protein pipiens_006022 [Culex pipiens pipiens]|uniref:Ionotropic receptor n=1 Tax=Culex pipiens pipiens TaxID=38569 RepID=A0ABD1DTV9_CULPP